jgi:hypothetical protein
MNAIFDSQLSGGAYVFDAQFYSVVTSPEIVLSTGGGGGGASVRKWMKSSGVDDDIEETARKLGLKVSQKAAKVADKKADVVPIKGKVQETQSTPGQEVVTMSDLKSLEARIELMEARLLKQIRRNEEEYFIWRAIAERVL